MLQHKIINDGDDIMTLNFDENCRDNNSKECHDSAVNQSEQIESQVENHFEATIDTEGIFSMKA